MDISRLRFTYEAGIICIIIVDPGFNTLVLFTGYHYALCLIYITFKLSSWGA